MTWADIFLCHSLQYLEKMSDVDVGKHSTSLVAHRDRILNMPRIKRWIEERPETSF